MASFSFANFEIFLRVHLTMYIADDQMMLIQFISIQ